MNGQKTDPTKLTLVDPVKQNMSFICKKCPKMILKRIHDKKCKEILQETVVSLQRTTNRSNF